MPTTSPVQPQTTAAAAPVATSAPPEPRWIPDPAKICGPWAGLASFLNWRVWRVFRR